MPGSLISHLLSYSVTFGESMALVEHFGYFISLVEHGW